MRRIVFIVVSALLAGCQSSPPNPLSGVPVYPPINAYELTDADLAAIAMSVKSSLRDPASAIFGDVRAVVDARGTKTVCGLINGRNGFGGYTGFTPYIGMLADNNNGQRVFLVNAIGGAPSDTSTTAIVMMCQHQGVSV